MSHFITESELVGIEFEQKVFGTSAHRRVSSFGHIIPIDWSPVDAIQWVTRRQFVAFGWYPAFPTTSFGRELLEAVKGYLTPRDRKKLRLYVSVGTTLDRYYGIDGFFKLLRHIVTIDVTTMRAKRRMRADILIRKCDFEEKGNLLKVASLVAKGLRDPVTRLENRFLAERDFQDVNVGGIQKLERATKLAAVRKAFGLDPS